MHSLQVILGGFALWATAGLLQTMFALRVSSGALCLAFSLIWLLVAGGNMALGMRHAGYTFMQELPFFILVYSVPVLAAVITTRMTKSG